MLEINAAAPTMQQQPEEQLHQLQHGRRRDVSNNNIINNNNNNNNNILHHNSLDNEYELDSTSSSSTPAPSLAPPFFDFGMPRNITARSGQTAAINCRVQNLGDKSVSWIRKRDLHILTAGILTYTSDERFKVIRTDDSKDWSLHVKFAQPRDSGIYECQVNTEPKISMAFRLNVIVTPPDSKAFIAGPADLYAKVGSAITLNCHVKQPSSQDIGPIHWYRGPYIITPFVVHPNDAALDLSRRISMESQLGDILKSRLRIANAHTADSGNYTCMPTTAEAASVMVHVINDENPAAMQKSSAAPSKVKMATTMTTKAIRWLNGWWHQQKRKQVLTTMATMAKASITTTPTTTLKTTLTTTTTTTTTFLHIICFMQISLITHHLFTSMMTWR